MSQLELRQRILALLVFPTIQAGFFLLSCWLVSTRPGWSALCLLTSGVALNFTIHICVHELLHYSDRRPLPFWADVLISLVSGIAFDGYRVHHHNHHRHNNDEGDFSRTWRATPQGPVALWRLALRLMLAGSSGADHSLAGRRPAASRSPAASAAKHAAAERGGLRRADGARLGELALRLAVRGHDLSRLGVRQHSQLWSASAGVPGGCRQLHSQSLVQPGVFQQRSAPRTSRGADQVLASVASGPRRAADFRTAFRRAVSRASTASQSSPPSGLPQRARRTTEARTACLGVASCGPWSIASSIFLNVMRRAVWEDPRWTTDKSSLVH